MNISPPTDGRLDPWTLACARRGDLQAAASLVRLLGDRLPASARRCAENEVRHHVRESDVLQSAYLRIWLAITSFRGTTLAELRAWAEAILRRSTHQRVRYTDAQRRDGGRLAEHDPDKVTDPAPSPAARALARDELSSVQRALRDLPAHYAEVLSLHSDPNQRHADTAEKYGRSAGANRILLKRARAALRSELRRRQRDGS